MKAICVHPGQKDSTFLQEVPEPKPKPEQAVVRVLRAGLCGTDAEINSGLYGQTPPGFNYLILGHENFGIVEEVGRKARGRLRPGDFVVSSVRRPCGICWNCKHGENDMCTSGKYIERGIKGRHGFMSEFYSESPDYMFRIPKAVKEIGVLLEPTSIVEKGIEQAFRIQQRMQWRPGTALVMGAGPVGLLAAAVLGVRGLRVIVVGREPSGDLRAKLAPKLGAAYFSVANTPLAELPSRFGPFDLLVEATGNAGVVFAAMQIIAPNGVLCLLSVTGGNTITPVPADQINQELVLRNNVVFGSVNANPRHFASGVKDFVAIERKHPGALEKLITQRLPMTQFKTWFAQRGEGIKTTLEFSS